MSIPIRTLIFSSDRPNSCLAELSIRSISGVTSIRPSDAFGIGGSSGYSFQLEMNHRAWKRGLEIAETPISFTDRERGYSKITPGIALESIKIALKLRFGGK